MTAVLMVIDTGLGDGGAARVASRLMKYWLEDHRRVTFVSLYGPEKDFFVQPSGVNRVVLGWDKSSKNFLLKLIQHILHLFRLRRAIRSSSAQVVVSFLTTTNVRTVIACLGLGKRVVVSERSDIHRQRFGSRWGYLRRWIYPFADMVTANSSLSVESMGTFLPSAKLAYVPNPVEIPSIAARPSRSKLILTVGRLIPLKNQVLILEAISKLNAEFDDWILSVLGDGPEHAQLQNRAKELNIDHRLKLMGSVKDPSPFYQSAGIFVLPSLYEGTPNSLLEAMAYGLPCVISDTLHGAKEHVKHQESGLVFQEGDENDLAEKLSELMESSYLRDQLGQAARKRMGKFTPRYVMKCWDQVLFPSLA